MWYLPVKMALDEFKPLSRQAQAEALCADWPEDMLRIVTAPQSAQPFHVPVYEIAPADKFTQGRVALIGDAACTFGPLLGLGVNKAIEDAYVLAALLRQTNIRYRQR